MIGQRDTRKADQKADQGTQLNGATTTMLYKMKQRMADSAGYVVLSFICSILCLQPVLADDLTNGALDDSTVGIIDTTTRIIGGSPTSHRDFPFVVTMVRSGAGPLTSRHFCGATIINEKWLLTAAHCMFNFFGFRIEPESFRVAVGVTNLRTQSPEELVVANYYIHPEYVADVQLLENDIALIELANVIPGARTISLYDESAEGLVGVNSTIIGYGAKQYISSEEVVRSEVLRSANIPIVSKEVCNSPISYAGTVNDSHICAGFAQGGVDSCSGDSGGPLIAVLDGVPTQLGVVSSGNGCALPQFYGLYTDVGRYTDWIKQFTQIETTSRPENVERGGSAGSSSGSGATWVLLWLMVGVFIKRRVSRRS